MDARTPPQRAPAWKVATALVLGAACVAARGSVAADCNGNGVPDEADIASGASADCNSNGLPDDCEGLPLLVGPAARLVLPAAPGDVAVGDLDRDGRLDLVVATPDPPGFTVFLAPESGGAGVTQTLATPALGLALGDLDRDGDLDLALARSSDIRTFLNAGNGTFPERGYIAEGGAFAAVRLGDLDGDGIGDAVASRSDRGAISVFSGLASGVFAAAGDFAADSPGALALGDLDRDGDLDVVVLSGDGRLRLLRNEGGGALGAASAVATAGEGLRAFDLRDLDGDGRPDLAAIGATTLAILSSQGDASFDLALSFAVADPAALRTVTIGDPDGDGRGEVVLGRSRLGSAGELQAFETAEGGGWLGSLPSALGPRPAAVRLADLDGDGTDEAIVASASPPEVRILRRRAGGDALPPAVPLRSSALPIGQFEPHTSILADLDRDGDLDIATIDGEDRVMVLCNPGGGIPAIDDVYTLRDADELISIVAADLDGDEDLDIAAVDEKTNYLLVLLNQGDATFEQTEQSVRTGTRAYFVVAADLDGDGDIDVAVANEGSGTLGLHGNTGNARFGPGETIDVGTGPVGLAAGDLDDDGDVDLAVAGTSRLTVLSNEGGGVFVESARHDVSKPSYLSTADLDRDGDLDLVVAREADGKIALLRNGGSGDFAVLDPIDLGQPPRSVIAVDLDGDGAPELVTGNEDRGTASVVPNMGDGRFAPPARYTVGKDPRFVVAGDLDGDGDPDLVVANHTSLDLTFLFNDRQAAFGRSPTARICTELDLRGVSRPLASDAPADLEARYLVRARPGDASLLGTSFLGGAPWRTPWDALRAAFPARFPGLDETGYRDLVGRRATRRYFSGALYLRIDGGRTLYGFSVDTDPGEPRDLLSAPEVAAVLRELETAYLLRPLVYFPDTAASRDAARSWGDPGFPVLIRDPPIPFRRGDATADGKVDLTDSVALLGYLFRGAGGVECAAAADANDDGGLDLSDAVGILLHLFGAAGDLPAPFEACGIDRTGEPLPCAGFAPCGG